MGNFIRRNMDVNLAVLIIVAAFLISIIFIFWYIQGQEYEPIVSYPPLVSAPGTSSVASFKDFKKFVSETDFKDYLEKGAALVQYFGGFGGGQGQIALEAPTIDLGGMGVSKEATPSRVSETTVQVAGIDEPDVVKTDGKEIYFSPTTFWWGWQDRILLAQEKMISPYPGKQETKIIKAFPPSDLTVEGKIENQGDLLLTKNTLAVFTWENIVGYDVSDPKNPKKQWSLRFENNGSLVAARLYKDKIYLVTKNSINEVRPCPIKPLSLNEKPLTVECSEIYHPILPIPVDVTFTALVVEPASGEVEKKISFVGSSGSSLVYMSENGIYVTYSYLESLTRYLAGFFKEKGGDLVPRWLTDRIDKLENYDISSQSKIMEFQIIWDKYLNSLDQDERLRIENELANRMTDYDKAHKRELEKTGIVKIGLESFEVEASGNVPGTPLNQFSLDEYKQNLRLATTISQRWGILGNLGGGESTNDVYVLDKDLKIVGRVLDLGLQERIYSARFIEDKGYLVTFRQTDPFYVLDLSNPKKPELKGELKIPGYSSYLHPITKDKILGFGQEDWRVKISLFDVTLPENPKEIAKYILDESWSDILSTHHAFLLDKKHNIFFLPGSRGGYIFSFENDKLELKKAVSNISAKRALYLDDYLYVIGDDKIVVLNELDWQRIKELEFSP